MQVVSIVNLKGGVGKTTSAANLGYSMAVLGKRVLLIDADPQGSLSASLGIGEPDEIKTTLATILMNIVNEENIDPEEGIYHHEEGVDLLPGNSDKIHKRCFSRNKYQSLCFSLVKRKYH